MTEVLTVTGADLESLVGRLDELSGSFSDRERAVLAALVALAGDGIAAGDDVQGFAFDAFSPSSFSLNFLPSAVPDAGQPGANSYLIGLLRKGTAGVNGDG